MMIALKEGMVAVVAALLTGGHQAQSIEGVDPVQTMGEPAVQCMIGMVGLLTIEPEVQTTIDIAGKILFMLYAFVGIYICW